MNCNQRYTGELAPIESRKEAQRVKRENSTIYRGLKTKEEEVVKENEPEETMQKSNNTRYQRFL